MNLRLQDYEPCELPNCSIPHLVFGLAPPMLLLSPCLTNSVSCFTLDRSAFQWPIDRKQRAVAGGRSPWACRLSKGDFLLTSLTSLREVREVRPRKVFIEWGAVEHLTHQFRSTCCKETGNKVTTPLIPLSSNQRLSNSSNANLF